MNIRVETEKEKEIKKDGSSLIKKFFNQKKINYD